MINAIGILASTEKGIQKERNMAYLQASYIYGVEAYIFVINEISNYIKNGYINAYKWEKGQLLPCKIDMPKYIEIYVTIAKLNKLPEMQWLKENTVLLDRGGISKLQLQQKLAKSQLAKYSIPSFKINTYSELISLLQVIPDAILKPIGGRKAKGIMKLLTKDGQTTYETKENKGNLTPEVFAEYISTWEKKSDAGLVLEPCLNIRNDRGRAVDFRCLVSKGENGQWTNALTYGRIGGSSVASNFSNGGSLCFAIDALKQFIPERATEVLDEIDRVAVETAELVNTLTNGGVSFLGIDICFDRDSRQIYVIEANSKPGTKFVGPWPLALVRAQYYKHLIRG